MIHIDDVHKTLSGRKILDGLTLNVADVPLPDGEPLPFPE